VFCEGSSLVDSQMISLLFVFFFQLVAMEVWWIEVLCCYCFNGHKLYDFCKIWKLHLYGQDLSICSQHVPKNNLGVSVNFEKAHLKLQTPIKCKKKPMKRENEGKRWGALGTSLWENRKKNTHTHTHI